jgi:hypothetical protein
MALIRGTLGDLPCPVCLVPKTDIPQGKVYAVRTTRSMKKVYEDAQNMRTVVEREKYLQSYGLRDISVCELFTCLNTHSHDELA